MKLNIFSRARVISFLFILFSTTNLFAADGDGFSLFFQAPTKNENLGSYFTVDAGTFENLNQMSDVMFHFQTPGGIPIIPSKNEPIEVNIVVPLGAPSDYVNSYAEEVKNQLVRFYPDNAVYNIRYSYIDTKKTDEQYSNAIKALQEGIKTLPQEETEARQVATGMVDVLKEDHENFTTWKKSWFSSGLEWLRNRNPKNRNTAARVVGFLKGSMTLAVTVTKYGLSNSSFLIGLANGASTAAFGWFATEYSQWCTHHKLPLTKRFPWLEKIWPIGLYNNLPELKSVTINFIRSMGIAFLVRLAAHYTHQVTLRTGEPVEHPWALKFLKEGLGITIIETFSDSVMDVGLRSLAQKRHINYVARSYLLWGISFIDTFMHASFRSGDTYAAYVAGGISTVAKVSLYVAAKLSKAKPKQIVVISDFIDRISEKGEANPDFDYIKKQLSLTEAWNIGLSNQTQQKLISNNVTSKEIVDILKLGDLSGKAVRELKQLLVETQNPFQACSVLFSKPKLK